MSLLSPYYPADSQYAEDFPYSSEAAGSSDSERIDFDDPPIPLHAYVPSAANLAWRLRLASTMKGTR
ncbi:MAG TPA: hypothetical protein VK638_35810 [Edaphobacter sp.]|nr:hypothetical protein [Edaphobacter sp.]